MIAPALSELRRLRERNALLEELCGQRDPALCRLGLRPQGAAMFGLLLKRECASTAQLIAVLYAGRCERDWPRLPDAAVRQQMHHLRRALKPHGIRIDCVRDETQAFYALTPVGKAKARALMTARTAA